MLVDSTQCFVFKKVFITCKNENLLVKIQVNKMIKVNSMDAQLDQFFLRYGSFSLCRSSEEYTSYINM
jgi:hypothetical protein